MFRGHLIRRVLRGLIRTTAGFTFIYLCKSVIRANHDQIKIGLGLWCLRLSTIFQLCRGVN
jgi:hypothetical protein